MLLIAWKMVIWVRRWALKFCIVLVTLITTYSLLEAMTQNFGKCQNAYEGDPNEDVLLTSPFVKDEPKLVVLLSYQRSGSSFVSEWFNTNPDVFFNFEPVDSLYSAMYGTRQNANVPSDITNYPNGSIRILPNEELIAVSNFLRQFLLCELDSLPMQSLFSFYLAVSYDHLASADFVKCIRHSFPYDYSRCQPYLSDFCGARFGIAPDEKQQECLKRLWFKEENPYASSSLSIKFKSHQLCVDSMRKDFKSACQRFLQDSCQNRTMRVMKTVRATMQSMEPLLDVLPNFRVIHLVRDPRAVALSRKSFGGFVRGIYSGNDTNTTKKEAKLFCSTVVRDIKERMRLEKKYPGKIYALNFDRLIKNTTLYLKNVYRFLDETPHDRTVAWLLTKGKANQSNKTSEDIATQWQNVLTFRENKQIVESCREFYDLVKFNWKM